MVYTSFARVLHLERKSRYADPVSAFLYGNKNIAVVFVELNTPCIKITIDTDKFQVPIGVFGSFFFGYSSNLRTFIMEFRLCILSTGAVGSFNAVRTAVNVDSF